VKIKYKAVSKLISITFKEKLQSLQAVAHRFDTDSTLSKEMFLEDLSKLSPHKPSLLLKYHQLLLLLSAYPGSKKILSVAHQELLRISGISKEIIEGKNQEQRIQLINSGMPDGQLNVCFSFYFIKWLVTEFNSDVELFSIDADAPTVEQTLCACLSPVEKDLIADKQLTPLQMIQLLKDPKQSDLEFLVGLFNEADIPSEVLDVIWDSLKIFITWRVKNVATFNFSFFGKPFFHRTSLVKKIDSNKEIKKPLQAPVLLQPDERKKLVYTGRTTLALLLRETDPVTYADEKQVMLFEMNRGVSIALYPMIAERRLPLESYIGYIAFKNGIPVAYGGGWIFLHRCKIGVNIFPAFRGGESAFIFCQVLRLYYHHFNVTKFFIEPYQIGKNNAEGLKSGAYWFYYRLGFRSASLPLQHLALSEFEKIKSEKTYRTSLPIMKQLSLANLELKTDTVSEIDDDPLSISKKVLDTVINQFHGDRRAADQWALTEIFSNGEIPDFKSWSGPEMKMFNELALAMVVMNNPDGLKKKDIKILSELMRLKGAKGEREFIITSQKYSKFFSS
jgi:hypothetical protein